MNINLDKFFDDYRPVVHLTKEDFNIWYGNLQKDLAKLIKADTLSKPSVETPKEPLSFNCTLAKFAEQLDVPLWKAMEFGKYFKSSAEVPSVQDIEKIINDIVNDEKGWVGIGLISRVAQAISTRYRKENKDE